jgi:UDP-N-acetylglucosamine--N-acetylmuramyl-(pentapeptide) pyrophosphoryl-undecaprenol N-acetylglucosamine transferase
VRPYRFIISGGGTGGHIFPAIAIADALKLRYPDAEFLFVGARDRMEMEKVPRAGYPIKGLWISGLQRSLSIKNLMFPLKLISSLWSSRRIVRQFRPDVAIGTGGYASAPLLKTAARMGVPCLIQEQNSHAGVTNKWLSKNVQRICVAYAGMEKYFPSDKMVFTGNPVRKDLVDVRITKEKGLEHFNWTDKKRTVLVLGGSLGAGAINALIASKLDYFQKKNVQLLWQCGKGYYPQYSALQSDEVQVLAFIERMDMAYATADIIISRAGALSVSELCLVGKPVIFIPSPNVAEDHQTKNATAMVEQGAAYMISEKDLDNAFVPAIEKLLHDPDERTKLGSSMARLGRPWATEDIVKEIEQLLPDRS